MSSPRIEEPPVLATFTGAPPGTSVAANCAAPERPHETKVCDAISRTRAIAVGVVVWAATGCSGAPRQRNVEMGPVEAGAGSLTAARKFLEGRWALESFEVFPPGKSPIVLKGQGSLNYDQFEACRSKSAPTRRRPICCVPRASTSGTASFRAKAAPPSIWRSTLTYVVPGQAGTGPLALSRKRIWEVKAESVDAHDQRRRGEAVVCWSVAQGSVTRDGRRLSVSIQSSITLALVVATTVMAGQTKSVGAPEVFNVNAQVKGVAGAAAATLQVHIDRYTPDGDRTAVEDALKHGGYANFLNALRKAPEVGRVQSGERQFTIRWARQTNTKDGGRTIVVVTDKPILHRWRCGRREAARGVTTSG